MEWKVYGHGGRPVLYIPCQDGRFFDFEDFHMTDVWAPWIDAGQVCVFSIDTIDRETWSIPGAMQSIAVSCMKTGSAILQMRWYRLYVNG